MKLRKIWVLPLLLTLVCSVGCGGKADLLHGYEKVVSSMGSLARTSEHKLDWHANLRERQLHRSLCRHMSAGTGKRCGFRRVQLAGKAAASHGLGCLPVRLCAADREKRQRRTVAHTRCKREHLTGDHRQRRRLVSFGGICRFFRQRDIMQCLCEMKKSVSSGTVRFLLFHTDDRVSFC